MSFDPSTFDLAKKYILCAIDVAFFFLRGRDSDLLNSDKLTVLVVFRHYGEFKKLFFIFREAHSLTRQPKFRGDFRHLGT